MVIELELIITNKAMSKIINDRLEEITSQCKITSPNINSCISNTYSKAEELSNYLDKNLPFFDKSILTTDLCTIFSVLYLDITKICQIIPDKVNIELDLEVPERLEASNIRDIRNILDQRYTSPKDHVKKDILIPLTYLSTIITSNYNMFDYEDCLNLNILINIIYLDVVAVISKKNNYPIVGKDYKLDISFQPMEDKKRLEIEKAEEEKNKQIEAIQDIFRDDIPKIEEKEEDEEDDDIEIESMSIEEVNNTNNIEEDDDMDDLEYNSSDDIEQEETLETNNLTNAIFEDMEIIKTKLEIYTKIRSSIKVEVPTDIINVTSSDIVENLQKLVNDNITQYLIPIETELKTKCSETLDKIQQLTNLLDSYKIFIKDVQSTIKS